MQRVNASIPSLIDQSMVKNRFLGWLRRLRETGGSPDYPFPSFDLHEEFICAQRLHPMGRTSEPKERTGWMKHWRYAAEPPVEDPFFFNHHSGTPVE